MAVAAALAAKKQQQRLSATAANAIGQQPQYNASANFDQYEDNDEIVEALNLKTEECSDNRPAEIIEEDEETEEVSVKQEELEQEKEYDMSLFGSNKRQRNVDDELDEVGSVVSTGSSPEAGGKKRKQSNPKRVLMMGEDQNKAEESTKDNEKANEEDMNKPKDLSIKEEPADD